MTMTHGASAQATILGSATAINQLEPTCVRLSDRRIPRCYREWLTVPRSRYLAEIYLINSSLRCVANACARFEEVPIAQRRIACLRSSCLGYRRVSKGIETRSNRIPAHYTQVSPTDSFSLCPLSSHPCLRFDLSADLSRFPRFPLIEIETEGKVTVLSRGIVVQSVPANETLPFFFGQGSPLG